MDRLTKRSKDTVHDNGICCTHFRGLECFKVNGNCSAGCPWEEAVWERLAAYEDTGLMPQACAEAREAGKVLSSCDISFGRLAELLTADRDGRLVVLPCKVSDTVYILRRTFDGADVVGEAELWWDDIPQLGKTVFPTREEAEKALEVARNG